MSRRIIDQDWELNSSPLTLAGTFARSTTNAMDGTDLRGGNNTAADGNASYSLAAADRPKEGSAKAMLLQVRMKYKTVVQPAGGTLYVLRLQGSGGSSDLFIPTATNKLQFVSAASGVGPAAVAGPTALGTTAHVIDMIIKTENFSLAKALIYLDGALEITYGGTQTGSNTAPSELSSIFFGVAASNKCTWDAVWGRMQIWASRDPS